MSHSSQLPKDGELDTYSRSIGIDLDSMRNDEIDRPRHKQTSSDKNLQPPRAIRLKPIAFQAPRNQKMAMRALATLSRSNLTDQSTPSSAHKNKSVEQSPDSNKTLQTSSRDSFGGIDSSSPESEGHSKEDLAMEETKTGLGSRMVPRDRETDQRQDSVVSKSEFTKLKSERRRFDNSVMKEPETLSLQIKTPGTNLANQKRSPESDQLDSEEIILRIRNELQQILTVKGEESRANILAEMKADRQAEAQRWIKAIAELRHEHDSDQSSWKIQQSELQTSFQTRFEQQQESIREEHHTLVNRVTELENRRSPSHDPQLDSSLIKDEPVRVSSDGSCLDDHDRSQNGTAPDAKVEEELKPEAISGSSSAKIVEEIVVDVMERCLEFVQKMLMSYRRPWDALFRNDDVTDRLSSRVPINKHKKEQEWSARDTRGEEEDTLRVIHLFLNEQKQYIRERRTFLEKVHQEWMTASLGVSHDPSSKPLIHRMWNMLHASVTALHQDIHHYESLKSLLSKRRSSKRNTTSNVPDNRRKHLHQILDEALRIHNWS